MLKMRKFMRGKIGGIFIRKLQKFFTKLNKPSKLFIVAKKCLAKTKFCSWTT